MTILSKDCTRCRVHKARSEFFGSRRSKSGLQSWCKDCQRSNQRSWVEKNKMRRAASQKAARHASLGRYNSVAYARLVKRLYGITMEDVDRMYEAQEGRCAICQRHASEFTRRLAVDHDHSTGRIRGLLCQRCNGAVGWLELPGISEATETYLRVSQ